MENSSVVTMTMMNSSGGKVKCNDNSMTTSDCRYVDDDDDDNEYYDYYAALMLLVTGLPHTVKTILIVLIKASDEAFLLHRAISR